MVAETMEEVSGEMVAFHYQRIGGVNPLHLWGVVFDAGEVGMMEPEIGKGRPHVGDELSGMASVEVPQCPREHDNVPGTLVILNDELSHSETWDADCNPSFRRVGKTKNRFAMYAASLPMPPPRPMKIPDATNSLRISEKISCRTVRFLMRLRWF
jgi:hypothetical protein